MPFASSILVATDLSPASHAALHEGARVARETGCHVTLLYVFEAPPWVLPEGVSKPESTLRRIAEEATGAVHSVLGALRERYFAAIPGVDLRTVQHTSAAQAICTAATEWGVDLVVVATHGRSGTASAVVGNVTEKVVRAASCRVLVVPSRDQLSFAH